MDLSIIIPLYNEDESLPELAAWIERVMTENNYTYEIIMIDDGSTDDSWNVIKQLRVVNHNIRGIKFQRNYGKSAALNEGFKAAQGEVIITMDADMQDSPDEIPGLRAMILEQNFDLVSGWKKKRYDNTLTKNIPSKFFNAAARRSSGIKLHDFNCGLKAYRKKVVKSIEVYGEMHREKIRRNKIRLGKIRERLPGPGFYHVRRKIRQTPHALFRPLGNAGIFYRPCDIYLPGHHQILFRPDRAYTTPDVLFRHYGHDHRISAISCRLSRRAHRPQLPVQE